MNEGEPKKQDLPISERRYPDGERRYTYSTMMDERIHKMTKEEYDKLPELPKWGPGIPGTMYKKNTESYANYQLEGWKPEISIYGGVDSEKYDAGYVDYQVEFED